jgi:hypothetical protein
VGDGIGWGGMGWDGINAGGGKGRRRSWARDIQANGHAPAAVGRSQARARGSSSLSADAPACPPSPARRPTPVPPAAHLQGQHPERLLHLDPNLLDALSISSLKCMCGGDYVLVMACVGTAVRSGAPRHRRKGVGRRGTGRGTQARCWGGCACYVIRRDQSQERTRRKKHCARKDISMKRRWKQQKQGLPAQWAPSTKKI